MPVEELSYGPFREASEFKRRRVSLNPGNWVEFTADQVHVFSHRSQMHYVPMQWSEAVLLAAKIIQHDKQLMEKQKAEKKHRVPIDDLDAAPNGDPAEGREDEEVMDS